MVQRQRIRPSTFGRNRRPRIILSFAIALATVRLLAAPTHAQIQGDGTLETQVNGNLTAPCTGFCVIDNGTTRGSNLFHSFRQFSLPNGDVAAFVTAPTIQNVIVRVTGIGNPFISNINGTIATFDPAFNLAPRNFFLINPNGIVFGPGATLLNGGSFLATTAERMLFQDGTVFDTRDQTVAPLLTVSIPIGLQFGQAPGNIQANDSRLLIGQNSLFSDFALVGGDITLNNSVIQSPGQRIELGGVAGGKTVEFSQNGNTLQLVPLDSSARANVSLINQSRLDTFASGGGDIAIYGRDITLTEGSGVGTGIGLGLSSVLSQSGDIVIDGTGIVSLRNGSALANGVLGIGNSGRISVSGQRVELVNKSILGSLSQIDRNLVSRNLDLEPGCSKLQRCKDSVLPSREFPSTWLPRTRLTIVLPFWHPAETDASC